MAENGHDTEVSSTQETVAVRLPPFWPDKPALWFAQAEVQFELTGICSQKTKFNQVVSQFNQQVVVEVEDIIIAPPAHDPYDRLKAELINRLSTSREKRVRQLLSHEEVGDRKPSQFLRHLKSLVPDVSNDFLRTIWISRLPPRVQAILAGQTEGSLDATARLADKICEVTPSPNAASIAAPNPNNTNELQERIGELERQLASLRTTRSHSRSHSRHRSKTPAASPNRRQLCWYHRKFNNKARKCTPPCAKHSENLDSGR